MREIYFQCYLKDYLFLSFFFCVYLRHFNCYLQTKNPPKKQKIEKDITDKRFNNIVINEVHTKFYGNFNL